MKSSFLLSLLVLGAAGNVWTAMAQSAGTFSPTGNMTAPRFGQTAILLPDGKVLIAGGNASGAELYDPVTGTFTGIGSMTTIWPTGGVLLPDGRVLFAEGHFNVTAEGQINSTGNATVGFYDPITGTFNVAGSLATLTAVGSATMLNDGRVLLVGSIGTAPAISGAEVYDPASETFSPAAVVANWPQQMPAPPQTVLLDGRVLLRYVEDYAELYDPSTGTLSVTKGPAPIELPPHATLLLNGKLLLTGGSDNGFPASVNWASLFDPASGRLESTGMMGTARDGHTATLLPDGTVLVAGGSETQDNAFPALASAELYDPAAGRFSAAANMTTARAYATATLLNNGQVLIMGGRALGSSSTSASSSAEIYTPAVLIPAPVLFSLSGDGRGQGAIWHTDTGEIASSSSPAVAGEALSMYTTSLADGGVVPPEVVIGGRLAEVLYFDAASGYPGYNQVDFRLPSGVAPGPTVVLRLTYLGRSSNEVTIGVR
jgi:hypothetical protein